MSEVSDPSVAVEDLFLLRGGKVLRVAERCGLARHGKWVMWRVIGVSFLITWVPLLPLAMMQGVAWGTRVDIPFLEDFLPYGRYFLAVPILIAADWIVGRRLGLALAELRRTEAHDREVLATLDAVVDRAVALWRGPYVMTFLIVAVYGVTLVSVFTGNWAAAGTWVQPVHAGEALPSMAGLWQLLVSAALLRLLTFRWLWRWLIWTWVLWCIAHTSIRVSPMHPDRAGGLGVLGSAQTGFATLVLVFSVQIGCLIANAVSYRGAQLASYQGQAVLFVVIALIFVFAPLLTLSTRLARAKWEAEASISGWANRAEQYLGKELSAGDTAKSMSGQQISSLCDYGTLFTQARQMRLVPVSNRDLAVVLGAALLPVVPLLFVAMPANNVLQKILRLLI